MSTMNLKTAMQHLGSSKTHQVVKALIWLRKVHIKLADGVKSFCAKGGLDILLKITRREASKSNHDKQTLMMLDIAFSIIANCVAGQESVESRTKVTYTCTSFV